MALLEALAPAVVPLVVAPPAQRTSVLVLAASRAGRLVVGVAVHPALARLAGASPAERGLGAELLGLEARLTIRVDRAQASNSPESRGFQGARSPA